MPGKYEREHSGTAIVEQVVRPTGLVDPEVEIRPARTQVDDVLGEIRLRTDKGQRVLITTLTKRMAEGLTDYLDEHGVRVRYMHSDIDTVERADIIHNLRLGTFDVLVGINLLREGLDIPEVSLVAILDADKEGFLRSDRSLIQTIGRAARNVDGTAILYADTVTGSMKRALEETGRRREKQLLFNKAHGIQPRSVQRRITDVMHEGYENLDEQSTALEAAKKGAEYVPLPAKQLSHMIAKLEKEMHKAAQNLEFEVAAHKRDELKKLKAAALRNVA